MKYEKKTQSKSRECSTVNKHTVLCCDDVIKVDDTAEKARVMSPVLIYGTEMWLLRRGREEE